MLPLPSILVGWSLATLAAASPLTTHDYDLSTRSLSEDLTIWADPFVGTVGAFPNSSAGGGNVFTGAAVPYGMVKVGIDCSQVGVNSPLTSANSGWNVLGNLTGVSMMHIHGTGGQPKYGVVSQMPILGDLANINIADNSTYWQNRTDESASPGYMTTNLLNGVQIELTASAHAGIIRYTMPIGTNIPKSTHVIVDLTHALPSGGGGGISQKYVRSGLDIDEDGSGYSGYAFYSQGWNESPPWKIYFCGTFDTPFDSYGTASWDYNPFAPPTTSPATNPYPHLFATDNLGLAAVFSWTNENATAGSNVTLESRVGISFISVEQACAYRAEVNGTFEDTWNATKKLWQDDVLSSVTIPEIAGVTTNATLKKMLYTALYGIALMPTNRDNENPGWNSTEPYYDDFYTAWDIFRSLTPLYQLIQTTRFEGIVRSLIDIWRYDSWLPDGRSSNWNGKTQGGSNSDNILGDAFIRGFDSDSAINWYDGYSAMKTDASVVPPINVDHDASDGGTFVGRNALKGWMDLGYVPVEHTRSISKTIEYSQNDFALYQVALRQGNIEDAKLYYNRASNWMNLWNANLTADLGSLGTFSGFMAPKSANGSWDLTGVNVTNCGSCEWDALTYEGLIWEYTFNVPHDQAALISLMGGDEAFLNRLDASFVPGQNPSGEGNGNGAGTALFNPGNEPDFLMPFSYNYVRGQQYRTVNATRAIVNEYYYPERSGIPGNSDAGAMQGWLLWNLMGIYPVSGQPIYLISSPFFPALDVRVQTSLVGSNSGGSPATLSIRANNLNETSYFVQGVKVNGSSINRSWLYQKEVMYGGTIEFDLGPEPSDWDSGELPPSLSTGGFNLTVAFQ